jgi:hypothetical protein
MAIEFAGLLLELADRIGPIVARHFREESIQENRKIFQRNVIACHDRVSRILYKDDGSPKRLAEDIEKDTSSAIMPLMRIRGLSSMP